MSLKHQTVRNTKHYLCQLTSRSAMEGQSLNLRLKKLSAEIGQATGGEVIFANVDSVEADDIEVYFIEDHTGWRNIAKIKENGVLSNNIMFYTPSYMNENITSNVKVTVQLRRPSDGVWSNALPFTFVPSLTNKDIPLEKQMDMHSNLKATHFADSSDSVDQDVLRESSKPAIQNPSKKCQKLHKVMERQKTIDNDTCIISGEFYHEVKSSEVKPIKYNLPNTDIQHKNISRLQQKRFSSEDSGFGSITFSNEEQSIEDVHRMSKTEEFVPNLDSQQSTKNVLDNASENNSDVDVDCLLFQNEAKEFISSKPNCISMLKHNVVENSLESTSPFTSSQDIGSGGITGCNIHFSPLATKTEVIPRIKVDCSGACIKLPGTGVQLIIPPYAIPEGSNAEIGLALDSWNDLNIPGEDKNEGSIAPIITCLPHNYHFQKRVLIVFPHSVKETVEEKECLYTSNNVIDGKIQWRETNYNQDGTSPILFLKYQYAYLFVGHFSFFTITLPSGEECNAKYMRIVVFANELPDLDTNQSVRIYCHGERDDEIKKVVEKEEKDIGGIKKIFKAKFELIQKSDSVLKIRIEYENGWLLKSPEKDKLLKGLWRKDFGHCQYIFANKGDMNSFYCRIFVQQVDYGEEELLEFSNVVKAPIRKSTAECLSSSFGVTENRGKQSNNDFETPIGNRHPSTDSGHASFHSEMSYYTVSHSTGPHPSNPPSSLRTPHYAVPRQLSCPPNVYPYFLANTQIHQGANLPTALPSKVPYALRTQLCQLLDPDMPGGNDWRFLASELKSEHLIRKLESTSKEPTCAVLQVWESRDEPIEMLVKHLHAIKRLDAANLVENHIAETNQVTKQQVLSSNNHLGICAQGAFPSNPNVPAGSLNQSSTPQGRLVGCHDYRSSPEETDGVSNAVQMLMSTSSSTSSISVTPDEPSFHQTSSDVFYDTNFNQDISTITRNTEDLAVQDNLNALISSNIN
ncbi:uncharacterized protein LOC117121460 isoform X2 [Anneissia japonica]|nr:uncharacterized protein LOC117121460 isoform X2 [Anneissia japonica]XP_033122573.1 uncharacterized protein LOC117121460 isoform X2 [Anneissia japonica]XP_033122579.1 uncharacterized protein LOC117121460 isoform X2 [Anneissia japonica]XP_033122589.1 uncharacterized protein LOC117121460 isoform X2 [Anneissia japonica]XP_033122596.1 uncharacterized protein LOC117121460 isoform X2 [Anneissia japonica]XP_033122605.1 uncharacterized protein LOC117121460 isoform X2 [Anneissia japonica]